MPALLRKREQAPAAIALGRDRRCEVVAPAGANLDLRRDQLARHRVAQHRIVGRGVAQLVEARRQAEVAAVEQRELLLDARR